MADDGLTGEALLTIIERRNITEKQLAEELGLTADQVHGRIYRHKQAQQARGVFPRPELFESDLGEPLTLSGDYIIIGDVHAPCTDYDFAALPALIAKKHLRKPRRLIITGDLFNLDQFSTYDRVNGIPSWQEERAAARQLLKEWLRVFDEVVWLAGNHERRLSRETWGQLQMDDIAQMVLSSDRLRVSKFGHCTIDTPTGAWRITHARNYSVNQLVVADQLAQKFQCNIISHHEHHLAIGWDRYKHFVIVNNGGLFDQSKLAYVTLDDSKSPNMVKGFTMLRGGYPYIFGPAPFTNWDDWL